MAKLSEILGPDEYDGVFVDSPSDQDYTYLLSMPYACRYKQVRAICASGTCTIQLKVNGTLVGSAVNVSSTLATSTISQSVSVGDKVQVTVSSNSSAADLEVVLVR